VSALQAEVLRAAVPRAALPGLQVRGAAAAPGLTRAHLEASLAAALALCSAGEYRRWLAAYARFLAEQADAGRLAEVCAALLGPVGSAAQAWDGDGDGDARMADADGSAAGQAAAGDPGSAWQPCVLGLDKRALLQEVLREMSRNRALQRTTQTYNDALADLQRAQAPAAAPAPTVAAAAAQATAPVPLASAAAAQAAQDGAAAPPAPS
jgi:protein HIRA/HIR1